MMVQILGSEGEAEQRQKPKTRSALALPCRLRMAKASSLASGVPREHAPPRVPCHTSEDWPALAHLRGAQEAMKSRAATP